MTDAFAQHSFQVAPAPATVANVMRPPLTTVEQAAHVAAAAYLMKHARATALTVLDTQTGAITLIPALVGAHPPEWIAVTCWVASLG